MLLMAVFHSAHSQQLMTESGSVIMNASINATSYDGVFDDDGEIKATSKTLHGALNLRLSYGLNESITLLTNLPLGVYNHFNAVPSDPGGYEKDQSVFHPGDMEAGIRFGIKPEDNFSASFTYVQSFGTSYRKESTGLNTGYQDYNSLLQFHIRYSKNPKLIFQTSMGYRKRYKKFSDEFHAGINAWYIPAGSWKFEAAMAGILPMSEPEENSNIYLHGLYHNNSGLLAGTGKIYYAAGRNLFYASYTHPFKGQFIYASGTIEFGVIIIWSKEGKENPESSPKDDSKARE